MAQSQQVIVFVGQMQPIPLIGDIDGVQPRPRKWWCQSGPEFTMGRKTMMTMRTVVAVVLGWGVVFAMAGTSNAGINAGSSSPRERPQATNDADMVAPMPTMNGGTLQRRPFSPDPTWDYSGPGWYNYTIKKRPFTAEPTFDWSDNRGNSGTIHQRPFADTPTWDSSDNKGRTSTSRQRPFADTPTYDWSDSSGNSGTVRKRPFSPTPTYDWSDRQGNRGEVRSRPFSPTPTWDSTTPSYSSPRPTTARPYEPGQYRPAPWVTD